MKEKNSAGSGRSRNIGLYLLTASVTLVMLIASTVTEQTPEPAVLSPQLPVDVEIPPGFPAHEVPIDFFDDYSWKTFIALVWPAKENERGLADERKPLTAPGPRVFETYKSDWEIFHPDGSAPHADWNGYNDPIPCKVNEALEFGDLVLAFTSKFANLAQAGFGKLEGPLVAQNMTYVRYQTGFNKIEFDKIQSNKLYDRRNLKKVVFPDGAIDIKSAWVDMTLLPNQERYYTREAWVFNLETSICEKKLVGLVGLHIVHKTPTRPQWIWTSFEHVDNIAQHGAQSPFTFNDGTGVAMPRVNPIAYPPPATPPGKFNVTRVKKIHEKTAATNEKYQQLLRENNSVWQFYQLVMTQWPIPVSRPDVDGLPANTFPGQGAGTNFANVTMETFHQSHIFTGCMACHNIVKDDADFLFSLDINASPSRLEQATGQELFFVGDTALTVKNRLRDPTMRKLKKLLEQSQKD